MSRRMSIVVYAVLSLTVVAAGAVCYEVTAVGAGALQGDPIDDETARTVSLAALSCPQLSGPRLAGQLMANAELEAGGAGPGPADTAVAALNDKVFKVWKPWPNAMPQDHSATVFALAHYMCDLAGQVRLTKAPGDRWRLALAAYRSGVPAVQAAKGIPAGARSYVDEVESYTAWYEQQPAFGSGDKTPATASTAGLVVGASPVSPAAIPDDYLPAVRAAGATCAQVTPARIAAQLMAASGFDPNRRSAEGAMGIAGFRTDVWSDYAPRSASPWDPDSAVSVLGIALCDLVATFTPMGGNAFDTALAAFRTGTTAVRQAGGVPRVPGVADYVRRVDGFADFYLTVGPLASASPPAAPSASPSSASPSAPAPSASAAAPGSRPPAPPKKSSPPAASKPPAPVQYKIINVLSGKVVAVAGSSRNAGDVLVQEPDAADPSRRWLLVTDADGTVRIRSAFNGLVLSPQDASTGDYAFITQVPDASTPATRWRLLDTGGGVYKIKNAGSGYLLALQWMVDTDGTKLFQHDDNGTADHLWRIVPAS
ncbi:RICIN domain-containing protein [Dactylosporangium sp. CA-092794]|uniref:RICIN domain-containing protein n=1 Tax=Dactylosporangium sp. CA-092794 TaxID=3239929 RepID=UPI003D8AA47F